ncbi:type IV toxin-antitoxin system AbiEi family antitoxin domain-containing protein, partial [Klebsiella pneumoniae]|nr:type IV toxin-antitoxin system AbiEi family antitoxin domain-containing protein [Klebsiella pneumoniae]
QKIDLGAGKRQIVENGKFNAQYQITVPERFQKE